MNASARLMLACAGIWGLLPAYSSRSAQVEDLEGRINNCFERSMNGKPLPRDGEEMRAVLAYMSWLSRGVPTVTRKAQGRPGGETLGRGGP